MIYNLPDDVKILWLDLCLAHVDNNTVCLEGSYAASDEKYIEYDEPSNSWVSNVSGGITYELDYFNNLSMFDCSTAPVEITGADAIYRRVMTNYLDNSLLPVPSRIIKKELDPIKAELKTLDQNIDEVWNEFEYVEEHSISTDDNHNIQTPSNSTTGNGYTVTGIVIE